MKKILPFMILALLTLFGCGPAQPVSTDAQSMGSMTVKNLYSLFERDAEKAEALLVGNGLSISGRVGKVSELNYYEPRNDKQEVLRYAVIITDESGAPESVLCTFHVSQKDKVTSLAIGQSVTVYGKVIMLPKAKYPSLDFCRIVEE